MSKLIHNPAGMLIRQANDRLIAVTHDGTPVTAFQDGWSCHGVIGFSRSIVLGLRHCDGRVALWFLDGAGARLGDNVDAISDDLAASLEANVKNARDYCHDADDGVALTMADLISELTLRRKMDLQELICPPDDDRLDLSPLAICLVAGDLVVTGPGKMLFFFSRSGARLRGTDLQDGWQPAFLVRALAPIFLLELAHDDGRRATWIFDQRLSFLCDVDGILEIDDVLLQTAVVPVLRAQLQHAMRSTRPMPHTVQQYLDVNIRTRDVFARRYHRLISPPSQSCSALSLVRPLEIRVGDQTIMLDREAILRTCRADPLEQFTVALRDGNLRWPSPHDGTQTLLTDVIILNETLLCYRFSVGAIWEFHVICGDRRLRVFGIYVPLLDTFVTQHAPDHVERSIWSASGCGFWELLLIHLARFGTVVLADRVRSQQSLVNVFPHTGSSLHIGHYLWNDLSGVERAIRCLAATQLPRMVVINGVDTHKELFGQLEEIFPELQGLIDRSVPDVDAFIDYCYQNNSIPIRLTSDYVSADLRDRIQRVVQRNDYIVYPARSDNQNEIMVVCGLRMEDRTMSDPGGFYTRLLKHLVDHYPGSTIVFDGYNTQPGGCIVIPGLAYEFGTRPPEVLEAELVETLRLRFAGASIRIVDMIARPISESLGWCYAANLCISVWGAGLAKYRWCANLPTLILTGQNNLTHRQDLHIYDSPDFMEAPTATLFPEPHRMPLAANVALRRDYPDPAFRECFIPDIDHVLGLLDRLVRHLQGVDTVA